MPTQYEVLGTHRWMCLNIWPRGTVSQNVYSHHEEFGRKQYSEKKERANICQRPARYQAWYILFPQNFVMRYCYPHFTGEEMESHLIMSLNQSG